MASYFLYVFPLLQHLRPVALETQSTVCLFSAMMNLITAFLLMILIGHSTSDYTLVCPYENTNISQNRRVWCKRDVQDENCCTGFSFRPGTSSLEEGIEVQDDGKSFTISIKTLTHGDGVYWCGFMTADQIIVKLAEDYFGKMKCYFSISVIDSSILSAFNISNISNTKKSYAMIVY
ncbi:hypothetical protein F2P79_006734 [Pimephales promelas]|nr:hypothetical protein F2P79_006734 [Pimephales promelas]